MKIKCEKKETPPFQGGVGVVDLAPLRCLNTNEINKLEFILIILFFRNIFIFYAVIYMS